MLRIAVPNKGALAEDVNIILGEAGYRRRSGRELVVHDVGNGVEFFFLRPKDIATYVGSGELDLGITGRDLALDSGAAVRERLGLGFGRSTFRYAAPVGRAWAVEHLAGKRVATSYPNLVRADLRRHGVEAKVVRLDGAVEISIQLGVADAIADVVESGRTLSQHSLVAFGEPLCESEAVLVDAVESDRPDPARDQLIARIQGVVFAQQYLMVEYDCPRNLLDKVVAITPGIESPTVSPLADPQWVAVRALVPRDDHNRIMDELAGLGAKAILALDIRSCRTL